MDIGAKLVQIDKRLAKAERSSRLASASLDDAALQVRNSEGLLRALIGVQADGTTAVNMVNGGPPPKPSAPVVTAALGGLAVTWDGQFADGAVMPLDWARIEVHASPISGFTPISATLQGTIETPQGSTVYVPADGALYVRILARNTSGTASDPTDQVGPTSPTPVVADDILDGVVTTLKLADDAVTAAKVATGAIGTTEIADNAVTTQKVIAGAIQAGQIATGAVTTDKLDALAVTAGKIAALAITTDKLDANTVTTAKLAAGSVDATALKADAITGKTITGGTITGTDISGVTVTGATVTGGTVQTGTTGARVVLTPSPPAGIVNRPSVLVYSSTSGELGPGILNAGPDTSTGSVRPLTVLTSPAVGTDPSGAGIQAALVLFGAKPTSYGGRFLLETNAPDATSTIGNAYVQGQSSATTSGTTTLTLGAINGGASSPATSTVALTGTTLTVTTQGVAHTLDDTALSVGGDLNLNGVAQGRGFVTQAVLTTNVNLTTAQQAIMTTASITWHNGRSYRITIWGIANGGGTAGLLTLEMHKTNAAGTTWKPQMRQNLAASASNQAVSMQTILTNVSGADFSAALCLTGASSTNAGAFAANSANVAYLLVEDCGSTSDITGQPIT